MTSTGMTGIFIAHTEFQALPALLRSQLIEKLFGDGGTPVPEDLAASPAEPSRDDEHFAELSPSQARDFINGCSNKTKAALTAMAKSGTRHFSIKDVAASLGVPASELAGVWSGLTRRTRTITGDPKAYLIFWIGDGVYDDEKNYLDHRGELTEMTYNSVRKALSIA